MHAEPLGHRGAQVGNLCSKLNGKVICGNCRHRRIFRNMFDRYFTGVEYTLLSCYFPPLKMWNKKEKTMFCVCNTVIPRLTSDPANEFFG